jgi:uncharacterized protein YeaO (DUF488 family)
MIEIKRAYEKASEEDGERYLVDRLWPRGVKKEDIKIKAWLKELAPSDSLRRWFGHREDRWAEFKRRYFRELEDKADVWKPLLERARKGRLTLVYGSRHRLNNAFALKQFLEEKMKEVEK